MIAAYQEIYDPAFAIKLRAIQRLLAEAYTHYFDTSDGYCKMSEGQVSITLPAFFWSDGQDAYGARQRPSVEIYSYVLGSGRHHEFDNIDDALAEVTEWHANEMVEPHDGEGDIWR